VVVLNTGTGLIYPETMTARPLYPETTTARPPLLPPSGSIPP